MVINKCLPNVPGEYNKIHGAAWKQVDFVNLYKLSLGLFSILYNESLILMPGSIHVCSSSLQFVFDSSYWFTQSPFYL